MLSKVIYVHPHIDDHLTRDGRRYRFVDCVMQDPDGTTRTRSYKFTHIESALMAHGSLERFRKTGLPVQV